MESCQDKEKNNQGIPTEVEKKKITQVNTDFNGVFQGVQPGYYLKNEFGDDLLVLGKKVPVPSSDYKFLFQEDGSVRLQQTNLEDNKRYYYEGNYRILSNNNETLVVLCTLSDGGTSNPTYTLNINKANYSGICKGDNQPVFTVKKQ
jgi:hypothetical protein